MSNITVAALLASEGEDSNSTTSYVVKNEEGQLVNVEYSHRERYYGEMSGESTNAIIHPNGGSTTVFSETGIMDQFSDSSQGVPDLEYQPQPTFSQGGQDLVSLALESSKVGEVQGTSWSGGNTTQEQLLGDDRGEVETENEGGGEDFPDEIECQLIQKNVLMNGQIQTIDFIMCNQCPRLFRTESLLWNHIKAKHKRRSYRRSSTIPSQVRRPARMEGGAGLEPGEIQEVPQHRTVEGPDSLGGRVVNAPGVRSPVKTAVSNTNHASDQSNKKEPVYIVGLDKGGSKRGEQIHSRPLHVPVERYQRQRARKRIYVDSNTGPFKCPGCDIVTFSNRRSLDLHMKRVHKAGIVECDECGRKVLDLKRHKEILHKRFKIYECPHCPDKYCTQEDLERHLAKVEKNNMVGDKVNAESSVSVPATPADTAEETFDSDAEDEEEPIVDTQEIMKKMEAKTFSCSECGLKTPSRMTYIHHVLNGCIMDMVLGESGSEGALDSKTPAKRGRKPLDNIIRKRPKLGVE